MTHTYKYYYPISFYIYKVVSKKGKNIFGEIKFKSKAITIKDAIKEAEDVKKSLIKQYKTKKVYLKKEMSEKKWATI